MIIADIHDTLVEDDKAYFRESREKLFGDELEAVQKGREERVEDFRRTLTPLRLTLKEQAWIGGDSPSYADYLPFGALQWARTTSAFPLLEAGDPVAGWFERCLDLHDGLGRSQPAKAA
jgi:glutathione S-transferase